jgi:DNA-directed RNA polymerase subunit RPC12/RpoP
MAKTKAELQFDYERHEALVEEARNAYRKGQLSTAISIAMDAWDHIDGMMQFSRRFLDVAYSDAIDSIRIVLHLAPLILDAAPLDKFADLLKSQRRIVKNVTANLADELAVARQRLRKAHAIWDHLERNGEVALNDLTEVPGGHPDHSNDLLDTWGQMEVIHRSDGGGPKTIRLATAMNAPVRGKCPSCGATGKAVKNKLLDEIACPKCHSRVYFVLLGNSATN